jgi:hypothetical protein
MGFIVTVALIMFGSLFLYALEKNIIRRTLEILILTIMSLLVFLVVGSITRALFEI